MKPLFAALAVALLSACESTQRMPMPDQTLSVADPWLARIYVTRDLPPVRGDVDVAIYDSRGRIGILHSGDYFCWERLPGTLSLRAAADGRREVRLTRVVRSGEVHYFQVRTDEIDGALVLRALSPAEGRRQVNASEPAWSRAHLPNAAYLIGSDGR